MRSRPTWRNFVNLCLILAALAVYFNVGWVLGHYYAENILPHSPYTFWQKFWAGGFSFLAGGNPDPGTTATIFVGVFWPVVVFLWLASWVVFALYYLLWLIFAGGIVKLLGLA